MNEKAEEPFQIPKDYTNGFHLSNEDLMKKREEIYAQIDFLLNYLRQIDYIYEHGDEILSEQEVRDYLKLDSINKDMVIPRDIPKIRMGMGYVYYKKDITRFLEARRRGGK